MNSVFDKLKTMQIPKIKILNRVGKPDEIILEKAVQGADGRYYQPKTYRFGDKFIRNDFGGHLLSLIKAIIAPALGIIVLAVIVFITLSS